MNFKDQGPEYDLMCLYLLGAIGLSGHWVIACLLTLVMWVISLDVMSGQKRH